MDLIAIVEYALKPVMYVWRQLKKYYTSAVNDGIDEAFQLALTDWSKHPPSSNDRLRLKKALKGYLKNATSYEKLDADTRAFIDCFKNKLSEQPAAHNYLMTLRADEQAKREEQNLLEHLKTQELLIQGLQGLMSRMEEHNMTPQYIRALLKELPIEQGLERTELALGAILANGPIYSEGAKCLVAEFVRFHFEHTDKIAEEVKRLREAGDSYLAETLEEIKRVLTGESEQSLTTVYEEFKIRENQNEVRILQKLIEAAQIQFSFGEARDFYERLINLAPTIEHRFKYARLLQSLNDFKKAKTHYEKVLQELRELSKQNQEAYKPDVAMTLNNLGILFSDTNKLKQAQDYYEEALVIRQDLAKQNPEAYKPDVAMTLNNLGTLFGDTNKLKQAQAHFEEALEICRELAEQKPEAYNPYVAMTLNNLVILYLELKKKGDAEKAYQGAHDIYQKLAGRHPEAYEIDYAGILVMGFFLLGKPKDDLEEAKAILDNYSEHPKAQNFLSFIE